MKSLKIFLVVVFEIGIVSSGGDRFRYAPSPCTYLPTFVSYYPIFNRNAPVGNGLVAGTFIDGTTVYVGTGNSPNCANQKNVPARISTDLSKPGASFVCAGTEILDGSTAQYLKADPNLKWVPTNTTVMAKVPGVVKVDSGIYNYFIGRMNLTDIYGIPYQHVSKVHYNFTGLGFYYWDEESKQIIRETAGFEVLACYTDG